jgi:hypothetical protein
VAMTLETNWNETTFGFNFTRTRRGFVDAFEAACGAVDIFTSSRRSNRQVKITHYVDGKFFTFEVRRLDGSVVSTITISGAKKAINFVRSHILKNVPHLNGKISQAA